MKANNGKIRAIIINMMWPNEGNIPCEIWANALMCLPYSYPYLAIFTHL